MSEMNDPYDDQLAAARYRAERRREQRERYARSKDSERHDRMAEEWEASHAQQRGA